MRLKQSNGKSTSMRIDSLPSMNIRIDDLITIDPITQAQTEVFKAWSSGDHMALVGTAGTGKTFLALYLAL